MSAWNMSVKAEVTVTVVLPENLDGRIQTLKLTMEQAKKLRDALSEAIRSVTPPAPVFDRY